VNAVVADEAKPYLDAFESTSTRLGGDTQVQELRRAALARFVQTGFPTTRAEAWKYTNLRALARRRFAPAPEPVALPEAASLPLADAGWPRIVFIDGHYAPALSQTGAFGDGIRITPLSALLEDAPAEALRLLEARSGDSGFVDLNTAFAADGVVIEIAADARYEAPLHLLFVSQAAAEPLAIYPRIVIAAGAGSETMIAEQYAGLGGAANFTNSVTDVTLDANATLRHCRIQQEAAESYHVGNTRVHQARDSRYISYNIDLGGLLVRNDLETQLDGSNAEAVLDGLFVLSGRAHCDNHTLVNHASPQTRSSERYKGILGGRARGVFNGKIYVAPGAQQTDSTQVSHNLLLSDNAEIDTKPELEIYADDVKCSHGATVGQLDETALFYLRSRGLAADDARDLLVTAFAREILDAIPVEALREYLHDAVQATLRAEQQ
jgi:Fe-S cluster assembly protein SufD